MKTYLLPMFEGRLNRHKTLDGKPTVLDELQLSVELNEKLQQARNELSELKAQQHDYTYEVAEMRHQNAHFKKQTTLATKKIGILKRQLSGALLERDWALNEAEQLSRRIDQMISFAI